MVAGGWSEMGALGWCWLENSENQIQEMCCRPPKMKKGKCLYSVAWLGNVGSRNDGTRDRSGVVFLMEGTMVFALLDHLGAKILALSVPVCRTLC